MSKNTPEINQFRYSLPFLMKGELLKTHIPPEAGTVHQRIESIRQQWYLWGPSSGVIKTLVGDYLHEQSLRAEVVRFEREKLRDLLTEARQRSMGGELGQESLVDLRKEVNEFTQKLDVLNRRMPMVNTDLETLPGDTRFVRVNIPGLPEANVPPLGEVGIRGVILDLRSDEEKQQKPHPVPLVFFTGWSADFKSIAAVEILAAVAGRVVISLSMPEHYTSVKPKNWGSWIKSWVNASTANPDASPYWGHAQIMLEVLKKMKEQDKDKLGMDFSEIDLTGYSAGGALDLALADYLTSYPDSSLRVRDIYAFNSLGFYEDNPLKMAWNFMMAGKKSMKIEQEKRRTFIVQRLSSWGMDFIGKGGFRVVTDIFAKKLFNPARLSRMQVLGKIKILIGVDDLVIDNHLVEQVVDEANQGRGAQSLIELTKVRNGGHNMIVGAAPYFAEVMGDKKGIQSEIDYEKLPKSHADVLRVRYFRR